MGDFIWYHHRQKNKIIKLHFWVVLDGNGDYRRGKRGQLLDRRDVFLGLVHTLLTIGRQRELMVGSHWALATVVGYYNFGYGGISESSGTADWRHDMTVAARGECDNSFK